MEVSGKLHASTHTSEKSSQYSLARRLSVPQSRPGRDGEKVLSLPLPGIEPRSSFVSMIKSKRIRQAIYNTHWKINVIKMIALKFQQKLFEDLDAGERIIIKSTLGT